MTRSSDGDNGPYALVREVSAATRTLVAEPSRARQPISATPAWLATLHADQIGFMNGEPLRARTTALFCAQCELSSALSRGQYRANSRHAAIHGALEPLRHNIVFRFADRPLHGWRLFDLSETASMVAALAAPPLTSPSTPRCKGGEDRA